MKIVVAVPHSHTWFWTQTCLSSLVRFPPVARDCFVQVVVIDNSPWSPAIKGVLSTSLCSLSNCLGSMLHVIPNHKSNRFHASALDCVVDKFEFDYLMALETDVLACREDWLQWFVDQMRGTDYAVGMWHHEQFVNPSCTLYRGDTLRSMDHWCKTRSLDDVGSLRWGPTFNKSQLISIKEPAKDYVDWYNQDIGWIAGPFAEKRGWPEGTVLREKPTGQEKGPGWYEPGQQLHHWAVEAGYTYSVCPTVTTRRADGVPLQSMYGGAIPDPQRQLESDEITRYDPRLRTAHLWAGTRALDIIKHEVHDPAVNDNARGWMMREARFWREMVPINVQEETLGLIRHYGWRYNSENMSDRDRRAIEYARECYADGGITW